MQIKPLQVTARIHTKELEF